MSSTTGDVRTCSQCGTSKPLAAFSPTNYRKDGYRAECKACHNAAEKARAKGHRASSTRAYKRAERLRRMFGITLHDYERMWEQQSGLCAICQRPNTPGRPLAVDHCHAGGHVRGLLCDPCNTMLGLARDRADVLLRAAQYLGADVEVKQDESAESP
jgi:hypothetical protein